MYLIKSTMLHWLLLIVILLSTNTFCTEEVVDEDGTEDYFLDYCLFTKEEHPEANPHCKRFRGTNDDTIIGGEPADPVSSPWVASIQDLNFDYPAHFCGATIISNFFLLTAAYCVALYSQPYDKIKVVVGEHNLAFDEGWEVDLTIKNVIIHPDYDQILFRYDVAIIEVHEEMHFNQRIQPIHLPHHHHHHHQDTINIHLETAKIYGWGKTQFSENPVDIKRQATIPLISFQECLHTAFGDIIAPPTMCAGDLEHGGVSSCIGDWGGPLVSNFDKHDHNGGTRSGEIVYYPEEDLHILIGVSSLSIGCGYPDTPNFYVEVRQILEWIHDNIVPPPAITHP